MTLSLFVELATEDGGIDLHRLPHAVLAVPNGVFESLAAGEAQDHEAGLLLRWGPELFQGQVAVRIIRSPRTYNFRFETRRPFEVFTTPAGNPRAARVQFKVDYTWACEQDITRAMQDGKLGREELLGLTTDLIRARRREQADGKIDAPPPRFNLGPGPLWPPRTD